MRMPPHLLGPHLFGASRASAALAAAAVLGVASAAPAAGQTLVASTFGPGGSFDDAFGQAVTAGVVPDSGGGFVSQAVAASFTYALPAPEPLAEFRFAATANDGSDPLQVTLLAGPDPNTATALERFTFTTAAPLGSAAVFTARSTLAPLLLPGQTYWIALAVAPSATAAWAWNVNDAGLTGVSVQNPLGAAWVAAPDAETPAFDVTAAPEPAPGVLVGVGVGVAAAGARARRRRARL
jgi:hypothetical protein